MVQSRNNHRYVVWTGVLLAGASVLADERASAQRPEDPKARFLREAPAKWAEYKAFATQLQGEYRMTSVMTDPKQSTTTRTDRFKQGKGSAVFTWGQTKVIEGEVKPGSERVWGQNTKYSFELAPKEALGSGWVVSGLEIGSTKPLRLGRPVVDEALNAVTLQFRGGLPKHLAEICREPNFLLQQVTWADSQQHRHVRIEFAYKYILPGETDVRSLSGWALLDPEHYWHAIELFEVRQVKDYTGSYHFKFEFRNGSDGRPIIQRSTSVVDGKGGKGRVQRGTTTIEWDCRENATVPESECTLSAFGIPEPLDFAEEPRTNYILWLLGCALALFFLAGLFGYLKRRGTTS